MNGEVHTAKQAPHRPGIAPALGSRSGCRACVWRLVTSERLYARAGLRRALGRGNEP